MDIIAGFPGTGKSHFCDQLKINNFFDSDSSNFSWLIENGIKKRHPEWPNNYIDHIKSLPDNSIVFVSTHKEVLEALTKVDLFFIIVLPQKECKEEYLKRYKERNNDDSFIQLLDKYFVEWIEDIESNYKAKCVWLTSQEYLSDRIVYSDSHKLMMIRSVDNERRK